MKDAKVSLVLHVGMRNTAVVDAVIARHPELKLERISISSVDELSSSVAGMSPDLILLEQDKREGNSAALCSLVESICDAPILLLAHQGAVESALQTLRGGVYNYLTEPLAEGGLYAAISDALRMKSVWRETRENSHARLSSFGRLIGSAPCMQALYETIKSVSMTDATVFVQGPSGTGKELVARAIHDSSLRASNAFIAINCGAIPPTLLESELFGHERGAFTGAVSRSVGKFEQANNGTLFLDEVTELPLDLQVKLLRIIQEMQVVRIGGKDVIPVDVRLVCASNRDVAREVREGRFREDLYYRLNVFRK